jgi:tetratricopeptide (TPR) repeat protein
MRLVQCALQRLEQHVLGVEREGDIEGGDIPQVYFDYLRSGDARELARVVEHNRLDILSMVALLAHAVALYRETPADLPAPDLFSLGRIRHGHGDREAGRECMSRAVDSGLEEGQEAQALWLMARAHRQAGEFEQAVAAWQRLVALVPEDPQAYVELAKHHEHRTGDLAQALEWVRRARRAAGESPDLDRRETRIRRRLGEK